MSLDTMDSYLIRVIQDDKFPIYKSSELILRRYNTLGDLEKRKNIFIAVNNFLLENII